MERDKNIEAAKKPYARSAKNVGMITALEGYEFEKEGASLNNFCANKYCILFKVKK